MAITALLVAALGYSIYFYAQRMEVLAFAFFAINELWKLVLETPAPLLTCFLWWMKLGRKQLCNGATAAWQWLRRA